MHCRSSIGVERCKLDTENVSTATFFSTRSDARLIKVMNTCDIFFFEFTIVYDCFKHETIKPFCLY